MAEDVLGDITPDLFLPADGTYKSLDHAGRELGYLSRRHEKDRADVGSHIMVDVFHPAFELKIGGATDSSENVLGILLGGEVDEIAVVEMSNLDIGAVFQSFFEHVESLLKRIGIGLFGICAYGDNQSVEEFGSLLDHPQMTVGEGIEASGVNGGFHDVLEIIDQVGTWGRHDLVELEAL